MLIKELAALLDKLKEIKNHGGKKFKDASRLLNNEATTHNIMEIQEFVDKHS